MIQCLNSILKEVMNMDKDKSIKLFEQKNIRTHWDEEQEKWFFSIQDVVGFWQIPRIQKITLKR